MSTPALISAFTPSNTPPEVLDEIFVQRHRLLQDSVERLTDSVQSQNRCHLLFIGARGTGKTHFVTLLVHRLSQVQGLEDTMQIAWLNEDQTITTVADLLLLTYEALAKRYPADYPLEDLARVYDYAGEPQDYLITLLKDKLKGRSPVLVMENLDLQMKALGDMGQKKLRAFFQEHPIFSIAATAQALTEDLHNREKTFYGFFQNEHMVPLELPQAREVLQKVARHMQQTEVVEILKTPRGYARVRALHHLSGGNHRIFIVLSGFITKENIDQLISPFSKMVDELTPYYQERLRALSAQQRKIIEYLCTCANTVNVKDVARRLFATPQTISSQLKDLKTMGYVLSAKRGREAYYEVAEPMMRIAIEVKENQSHAPLRLLVDFIRAWYEYEELLSHRDLYTDNHSHHAYLSQACLLTETEGSLREQILIQGILEKVGSNLVGKDLESHQKENYSEEELAELDQKSVDELYTYLSNAKKPTDLLIKGVMHFQGGEYLEAIEKFTQVINHRDASIETVAIALINRGVAYVQQGEMEKALTDYAAVISLAEAPIEQVARALYNRGVNYGRQGEVEKALTDYTAVVTLENAPTDQVAKALNNRGVCYGAHGEMDKALADLTKVVLLGEAPAEQVSKAFYNRGVIYGQQGKVEKELADYTAVIALEGSPNELVSLALYNCGVSYGQQGKLGQALANYTAVIDLENAPAEQVAKALNNRGCNYRQMLQFSKAEADFLKLDKLMLERLYYYNSLSELRGCQNRWEESLGLMAEYLQERAKTTAPLELEEWLEILYTAQLAVEEKAQIARELINLCSKYKELPALANTLTRLLTAVKRGKLDKEALPAWLGIWEEVTAEEEAFIIPMRLCRTGVEYLLSDPLDAGILLTLKSDERQLLQEMLK